MLTFDHFLCWQKNIHQLYRHIHSFTVTKKVQGPKSGPMNISFPFHMDEHHHCLIISDWLLAYLSLSSLTAVFILVSSVVAIEEPCLLPIEDVLTMNYFTCQWLCSMSLAACDFVSSGLLTTCVLRVLCVFDGVQPFSWMQAFSSFLTARLES